MTKNSHARGKFSIPLQYFCRLIYSQTEEDVMLLFQIIKNYLSAPSKSEKQSLQKKYKNDQGAIQHLSTTECLEVAGGPQVRNEPDIG